MILAWVPVHGTPELNCSLVKDFIPLCRIFSTGSQCTIPFSTSLNGLCWVLIDFCSTGCKYLGKLLHFFQHLQSFPSEWAIMKPLKSMFAVQEESFHVLASTRHPAPLSHCESVSTCFSQWNVREAKGWETPLVTILNALCLEKRLAVHFLPLQVPCIRRRAQVTWEHSFCLLQGFIFICILCKVL